MKKKTPKYVPPEMYESWGGEFKPKRYEVRFKETENWVLCKAAKPVGKDSLHYMLFDGTQGVAPKGTWREKGQPMTDPKRNDPWMGYTIEESDQDGMFAMDLAERLKQKQLEDDDNILEV